MVEGVSEGVFEVAMEDLIQALAFEVCLAWNLTGQEQGVEGVYWLWVDWVGSADHSHLLRESWGHFHPLDPRVCLFGTRSLDLDFGCY